MSWEHLLEDVLTTSWKKVVATSISDQSKTSFRPKLRRFYDVFTTSCKSIFTVNIIFAFILISRIQSHFDSKLILRWFFGLKHFWQIILANLNPTILDRMSLHLHFRIICIFGLYAFWLNQINVVRGYICSTEIVQQIN